MFLTTMSKESSLTKLLGKNVNVSDLLEEASLPTNLNEQLLEDKVTDEEVIAKYKDLNVKEDQSLAQENELDFESLKKDDLEEKRKRITQAISLGRANLDGIGLTIEDSAEVKALKEKWIPFLIKKEELDSEVINKYKQMENGDSPIETKTLPIISLASMYLDKFVKENMPDKSDQDLDSLELYDLAGTLLSTLPLVTLLSSVTTATANFRNRKVEDFTIEESLSLFLQYLSEISKIVSGTEMVQITPTEIIDLSKKSSLLRGNAVNNLAKSKTS